jgi:ankyrin repeat protein
MSADFLNAVRGGEQAVVEALLAHDASLASTVDDNGVSAVLLAMYYGHPEVAVLLVRSGVALNLFEACAVGEREAAERLLSQAPETLAGYSPDGWTPLHLAVFFGHVPVARMLLERGADLAAVSRNPVDVTPLQSALAQGQEECVALLIASGADVGGGASKGWPPIAYAGANGLLESARLLLEHGADLNARTPEGKTALELAQEKGHGEVAALLREHGAV